MSSQHDAHQTKGPCKEWRPKQKSAKKSPAASVNMVFILTAEFRAPDESKNDREFEESVAQLTIGT